MSEEADETLLKEGDRVLGDYVIVEEIGRGGFGVVYRAVQEPMGRHVAIKTLRANPHDIPGYDFAEAFRREARHTSRLKHPNTITVHAYGETKSGVLCLVTEFLEGETLYHRLWRHGPMSQETTIQITRQIAKSLAEAHENGIIHGDLKPANVFLCNLHGEQDFVKVLDFGITKLIGEVDPAGLGTPEYMSPEQFSGQPLLAASDIYSLGLLMYEMVVGERPFKDEDTQKLARRHLLEPLPPMPREIEQSPLGYAIRTACAKEPAERFENGGVMVEVLNHMSGGSFSASGSLMRARSAPETLSGESIPSPSISEQVPIELSEPDEAHLSVGLRAPEPARSTQYRNLLVMVGRKEDRARLLEDVQSVLEQRTSQWILLGGAAGMGKSRLARWLVHEARLPQELARGSGAFRDGSPLLMEGIAEALNLALGLPGHADLAASLVLEQVEDALTRFLGRPPRPEELGAIRTLYGQLVAEGVTLDVMPMVRLLEEMSAVKPLLLHLDNLQDVDPSTLLLIETLAGRAHSYKGRGLLLFGTVRREDLPAVPETAERLLAIQSSRWPNARPYTLKRMSHEEAVELARMSFGIETAQRQLQRDPSDALIGGIVARSHGNPRYVLHLVQHLFDSDLLVESQDHLVLVPDVDLETVIPPRIAGFFRLRVAQLTMRHEQGKLLGVLLLRCALLGVSTPRELLMAFLKLEAETGSPLAERALYGFDALMAVLYTEDILMQEDAPSHLKGATRVIGFAQPILHQILSERIQSEPEARMLHGLVARAKKEFYTQAGQLPRYAEVISHHYRQSGSVRDLLRFRLTAARASAIQRRYKEVLALLVEVYEQTRDTQTFEVTQLRVIAAMAWFKLRLGDLSDLDELLYRGRQLAEALQDPAAKAELDWLTARHTARTGSLKQALEQLKSARGRFEALPKEVAPLSGDARSQNVGVLLLAMKPLPKTLGIGLCQLDHHAILRERGQVEAADQALQGARATFDAAGYLLGIQQCFVALAEAMRHIGLSRDCLTLLGELARRGGATVQRSSWPRLVRCQALIDLGQLEEAQQQLSGLITRFMRSGQPVEEARCYAMMATISDRRHQDDATSSYFKRALELLRQHHDHQFLIEVLIDYGRYLLQRQKHDLERAYDTIAEVTQLTRDRQARAALPRIHVLMGQLQIHRGQYARAKAWFQSSIDLATDLDDPIGAIIGHALMTQLYRFRDAPMAQTTAQKHLEQALTEAVAIQLPLTEVLHAQEVLAKAWQRNGQQEKASRLLARVLKGWQFMGDAREVQKLEAHLGRRRPGSAR